MLSGAHIFVEGQQLGFGLGPMYTLPPRVFGVSYSILKIHIHLLVPKRKIEAGGVIWIR
jgi:hypothetical protein